MQSPLPEPFRPLKRLAVAAGAKWTALSQDDALLLAELARLGWRADTLVWNHPHVAWSNYRHVLLRAVWDYHLHPNQFSRWVERLTSEGISIWNPAATIAWNMNKRYLVELAERGFDVVPTLYFPRGASAHLGDVMEQKGWRSVVIKPAVSASAYQTWRTDAWRARQFQKPFEECLTQQDMLVQPFWEDIERFGEWSLVFLGGEFSHAVLKRPQPGDFRVQEEYGGSSTAAAPPQAAVDMSHHLLAAVAPNALYARIDGFDGGGRFVLMELELIEPHLFLSLVPESAARMAKAIDRLLLQ